MTKKKHILFITTSSLATNPRLVKEFEFLKHEHQCVVVCFRHNDWSLELSEAIKARNEDVQFVEIDRRQSVVETLSSKLWHKLSIAVNPLFKTHFKICAFASNDKAPQLHFRIKKQLKSCAFERVVAHNLGAFYAATKAAKLFAAKLQLDIEDFYPGEALYFNTTHEKSNRDVIMQHSFKVADAITYASKGIALECERAYETPSHVKQMTIINAFKNDDFVKPSPSNQKLIKCVWFSQNIGPNRGLEQVFEAASKHSNVEFHLIGNSNPEYLDAISLSSNIIFHGVMSQTNLHKLLGTMDIGLALENSQADFNRDICLTNKFLAYAQAGLYILATDTFGQRDFLSQLDAHVGELITSNLTTALLNLDATVVTYEQKLLRWEHAKSFSWEQEQKKLLKLL